MSNLLTTKVQSTGLANPTDTHVVPAMVVAMGDQASWRYVEFFTANIRNPHTRRAYTRACSRFFAWCETRGPSLTSIRPFDVAAWIEQLQADHSAPGVKQQLAAVRMLFDWLITGQVVPINPLPSRARRGAACLYRGCRHRRGSQELAIPHEPAAQRDCAYLAADEPG